MQIPRDAVLLRIFFGEDDRFDHKPLHEAIVLKAREMGLAGATVLRGPMGFGANSHLHTAKILRLSEDLPVLIEIVDKQDKIDAFLPELDKLMGDGLVTLEKVHIIRYRGTAPTGKNISYGGIIICRIENDKFQEIWWARDTIGLMRQLGAIAK